MEESKEGGAQASDSEQAKLQTKVGKIIDSLTVRKAAAKKGGGFRNFMKTAKNDLNQMTGVVGPAEGAGGAAAAGLATTFQAPKSQPLIIMQNDQPDVVVVAAQPPPNNNEVNQPITEPVEEEKLQAQAA